MGRQASSAPADDAGLQPGLASSASAGTTPDPIRVERMEVHRGHLVCRVSFGTAPHETSPELMAQVLAAFPTLPQHACVNERGTTFAAVMNRTPLPHLLEHLVVDLQVRAIASAKGPTGQGVQHAARSQREAQTKPIVGTSEWLNEQQGAARIDVSFSDDLIALRAMRDAVAFLNEMLTVHGNQQVEHHSELLT